MKKEDKKLSLGEHLEELRKRVISSLVVIFAIGILAYVFRERVLSFLISLYQEGSLIYLHPTEAFLTYLKLAGLTGLILSTPWILFQAWKFIAPALLEHEERYFKYGFFFGGVLFYFGVALALLVGVPYSLRFLGAIGGESLSMEFSVRNYISFVSLLCFAMGLVFELPMIVFLMVKLNITTPSSLRKNRRFAILISFTVAAFLTPTDLFSQAFMAVPLILLYEISIWIVSLIVPAPTGEMQES